MSTLVGTAQEEDDAFWGHETWADDNDSGNESFRDSDEDSTLRKDEFDSDFNDSETDNEDEEEAAGRQEEKELQKQERNKNNSNNHRRRLQTGMVGGTAGGSSGVKKAGRGTGLPKTKRTMGNGMNAGLVLNLPPSMTTIQGDPSIPASTLPSFEESSSSAVMPLSAGSTMTPIPDPIPLSTSKSSSSPSSKRGSRMANELGVNPSTLLSNANARQRRSQTKKRDSRNATPIYSDTLSSQHALHASKRPRLQSGGGGVGGGGGTTSRKAERRRQYSQEELLVEAVQDTEPENERWLLARKRFQESADQDQKAASLAAWREQQKGKRIIQKYHSRRGCLITLTFPEMDSLPEILTRKRQPLPPPTSTIATTTTTTTTLGDSPRGSANQKPTQLVCAITGKPARYRDPKTGRGYWDSVAFKELRRRHEAGLSLDATRPIPSKSPKPTKQPKEEDNGVSSTSSVNHGSMVSKDVKPSTAVGLSPKPPTFVFDLGGDKNKSPGSTRSSGRKWKPSEKMLTGMGNSTGSLPKEEGPSPLSSTSELRKEAVLSAAPPLPNIASNKSQGKDNTASEAPGGTNMDLTSSSLESQSPAAVKEPNPAATTKAPVEVGTSERPTLKGSVIATNTSKGGAKHRSHSAATTTTTTTQSIIANSRHDESPISTTLPNEQVYIIPGDSENGHSEPRYVTQSELIMQVISNYNRSTMDREENKNRSHSH